MSLRVLLADESSTIKKVIQLALQDYGVQVKAVPIGTDVENVAREFKPDIVLADILLAKKSGYEIAQDFAQSPDLRHIPVILLWSGFITFDEARFLQSGACDRLEKPFEAESLRQLVRKYVPKLKSNVIAPFVSVHLPEFVEEPPPPPPSMPNVPPPPIPNHTQPPPAPLIDIPNADEKRLNSDHEEAHTLEELGGSSSPGSEPPPLVTSIEQVLSSAKSHSAPTKISFDDEPLEIQTIHLKQTSHQFEKPSTDMGTDNPAMPISQPPPLTIEELDEFQQVPLPLKNKSKLEQLTVPTINLQDPRQIDVNDAVIATTDNNEIPITELENPNPRFSTLQIDEKKQKISVKGISQLDPARLEEIVQSQVHQIVTEITWKILPDVVERVVREELQKLIKDAEKLG
ncbi:MAG: response regulator [Bdellovibrionaceae bacterium]|nr:response regulator [Pseudobdellovibrionaceae bacterium]MDW8190381.1 response regulator [Pseudobdellovibrionaceae bacterium]